MRLFRALIFLLIPILGFSQKTLHETQNKLVKTVRYIRFPNEEEKISNSFFEKLYPKDAYYSVSFNINYKESLRLQSESGRIKLIYTLSDFSFEDLPDYNKINVSRVLLPSGFYYRINLADKNNVSNQPIENDSCCLHNPQDIHEWTIFSLYGDSSALASYTSFNIVKTRLFYKDVDLERFNRYLGYVDEYYKTDKPLNDVAEIFKRINPDNIDMLPLYQIDLNKAGKDLEKIEKSDFYIYLDLSSQDPLQFKKRFREIKEKHAALSESVNKVMTNIDEVYFNKGYAYLLKKNYDKAAEYFERSIRSNPAYTRSHYRLGEVHFIKGDIDKSAEVMLHLIRDLKMEKDIEANALALAQQITLEYIDRGQGKIKTEEFHQAIKEFEKAASFCDSAKVISCPASIQKGVLDAKSGLYRSYLIIAGKALEGEKINLAAKFMYDARAFLNNNPDLKIEKDETDSIINKLIDKLVAQGKVQYENKSYEEAVDTYNKASDLCSLCENKQCQILIDREMKNAQTGLYENILNIIRAHLQNENMVEAERLLNDATRFQKENKVTQYALFETENLWMILNKFKYRNYISQGVLLLNSDSGSIALDVFMKAKALEKEHIAFPDYSLNTCIQTAGKPILLEMLSQAKIKAWGNDLVAAKKYAIEIGDKIKLFQMENDTDIISLHKDLVNRIKEQECANLSFEINRNMIIVQRYISNTDYIHAYELLSEMILSSGKDSPCNLDNSKYNKLLSEIKPFYVVQSDCKTAGEAMQQNAFDKADSLVAAIDKLFEAGPAMKGKISPCNRHHLIEHINDSTVLLNAAGYYLEKDSLLICMTALQQMFRQNISPAQTKSIQKKLATKLAAYDYKINKNASYSERMVFYKTANPWFTSFSRHYRIKWLKLKIFRK